MKSQHLLLLFPLLHGLCTPVPLRQGAETIPTPLRRGLNIVRTTVNDDGSIIDWIPLHSQAENGNVASPPPLPADTPSEFNQSASKPWAMLQAEGVQRGPEGTVPILRQTSAAPQVKGPPVDPQHMPEVRAEAAGDHWYASSAQGVSNHGGSASYSLYKAWTESNADFSLLQSAVIRYNVPKPGDNSQLVSQTVEAGW